VNAGQLAVRTAGGRVTIAGTVHTDVERQLAERDAWYVLGVDDVVNEIKVHP
jgi:osmotically-inducible protein OsmY